MAIHACVARKRAPTISGVATCLWFVSLAMAEPSSSETLSFRSFAEGRLAIARDGAYVVGIAKSSGKPGLFRAASDGSLHQLLSSGESGVGEFAVDRVSADPRSGRLAMIVSDDEMRGAGCSNRVLVLDTATTATARLVDNGRFNAKPTVAPGGKRVAYYSARPDIAYSQHTSSEGAALRICDVETGKEVQAAGPSLTPLPGEPPAWSPDGTMVAFVLNYGTPKAEPVSIVRADGSGFRSLVGEASYAAESIAWLDENTILFTPIGRGGIYRIGVDDREPVLVRSGSLMGPLRVLPDRRTLMAYELNLETGETTEAFFRIPTFEKLPALDKQRLLAVEPEP